MAIRTYEKVIMDKSTHFTIRRAEVSDAEAIRQIFEFPQVIRGTLQLPYPSTELWRKRLTEATDVYNLLVCVDGDVVGQLGLHTFVFNPRRRHIGQIGMAVRDDWQGKGAGSALMQAAMNLADQWLNLSRIELEVYTDNEPAIALYRKFGFVLEGTHPQYAYREGKFADVYAMARLRKAT